MDFYRWNIEKYRKATRHLSAFQHGCYRLLIDEYMETREPLPDNDLALANICRISPDQWADDASIIRAFFKPKDGLLFHDYCDSELDYQDSTARFRSEKAQKAAKKRWSKNNDLDAMSIPGECSAMPDKRQEIRDKKESTPLTPPPMFEKFWEIYPKARREPKAKVLPAYLKALKLTTEETIYEATRRYAASDDATKDGGRYAKGAIAWLNGGRWAFAYNPASAPGASPHGKSSYGDSIANAARAVQAKLDLQTEIRQDD